MEKVDVIEREITVTSPIDRVWEALTMAEHLAQWFGDSAEVDLRPGGEMTVGWSDYEYVSKAVVETVDYPTTFAYRWEAGEAGDGTMWSTKVTFTLEEADGMTTVRVVESGLSALPDELYGPLLKENSSGWTSEMADLQRHLEAVAAP
jgi:uncharacterized protein YndB with AHSA1/START domain